MSGVLLLSIAEYVGFALLWIWALIVISHGGMYIAEKRGLSGETKKEFAGLLILLYIAFSLLAIGRLF